MRKTATAFAVMIASLWIAAPAALAHTAFESSDPSDGVTLDEPISKISVAFSGEAEPSGKGFVVLDPSGELRNPDRVTSSDNLTWVLHFDDPIGGGTAGVQWTVAAPDAHPIDGTFSFTVPAVAAPATTAAGSTPPASLTAPAVSPTATTLDEFLDVGTAQAPLLGVFGTLTRSLSLLGAMVAIGGIVFAAVVLRGSERDIRSVLFWVRRASVLLFVGALGELIHQLATVNGDWLSIWPLSSFATALVSPVGLAISLRLIGGGLMLRAHLDVVPTQAKTDPVLALRSAVPVGAAAPPPSFAMHNVEPYLHADDKAWRVDGDLARVFAGLAATLAAFAFDGHTVTEGMRFITSLVAMAHAGAGAVWAGGLLMLVHVVWVRHRRGADPRSLQLAIRFSVVAAIALVVVGGAGTVLAATILDSFSQLWSTPWGRVLVAKVGVVAVAAGSGAYNHKVLIPRMMRRSPSDSRADDEFRRSASIEGAALLMVIILTAVLVAAAS